MYAYDTGQYRDVNDLISVKYALSRFIAFSFGKFELERAPIVVFPTWHTRIGNVSGIIAFTNVGLRTRYNDYGRVYALNAYEKKVPRARRRVLG